MSKIVFLRGDRLSPLLTRLNSGICVLKFAAEGDFAMINRFHHHLFCLFMVLVMSAPFGQAQNSSSPKLSVHWEELTASDSRRHSPSQGTCLLPFGILEKHGPHLPIGTDLLDVRYAALHAAEQEYAVVFPEYYFGQISEARHEPGTIAYSREHATRTAPGNHRRDGPQRLQESPHRERSRRQRQPAALLRPNPTRQAARLCRLRVRRAHAAAGGPARKTKIDMHAGESETSKMMISRPDLVHMDRAANESGADQARQKIPEDVYTGIWWYTRFPIIIPATDQSPPKNSANFR